MIIHILISIPSFILIIFIGTGLTIVLNSAMKINKDESVSYVCVCAKLYCWK